MPKGSRKKEETDENRRAPYESLHSRSAHRLVLAILLSPVSNHRTKGKEHTYTLIHRESSRMDSLLDGELMALRFSLLKEPRILLFIMEL